MKALVLLSGGIDSSCCVAFYRQAGHDVTSVFVDYGQPVIAPTNSKAEFEAVIRKARRDFDSGNFSRDMSNAKRSGFFTSAGGRDGHVLSHHGQRYVDALPDRDAAKKVPGGKKRGGPRKKKAKK